MTLFQLQQEAVNHQENVFSRVDKISFKKVYNKREIDVHITK
jgi:hypothetical protein